MAGVCHLCGAWPGVWRGWGDRFWVWPGGFWRVFGAFWGLSGIPWRFLASFVIFDQASRSNVLVRRLGQRTRFAFRVGPGISPIVRALRRVALAGWLRRAGPRRPGVGGLDGTCRRQGVGELLYLLGLAELALLLGNGAAVLAAVAAGLVFGFLLALATHVSVSPMPHATPAGRWVRPGHWVIIGPVNCHRRDTCRRIPKNRR